MGCEWKYDVFISFLEKDTANTLTSHLFDALHQMGIIAFKEDKKLKVEDSAIHEETALRAIHESKTFIVILSEDYTSSIKCLRELDMIMERRSKALRVLPVFYHVDPSHVRCQSGNFEKHFDQHNKNAEAEIIKKITHQLFSSLLSGLTASNENLVGMTYRFNHLFDLLDLNSDKVHFLRIMGMGGIGKTTIAEVIYQKIADKFDSSCFLRISRSDTNIVSLQNQLLSTVFKKESFKIWDDALGAKEITRLNCTKVLLVLDGVSNDIQIEKLAGSHNWFGPGSRVIITTRSKDLPSTINKDLPYLSKLETLRYEMKPLEDDDSLQLFHTYAFETDYQVDANYTNLSEKIVEHAHGLPLALKVLGSALRHRPLAIWKEILENLGELGDKDIVDILKVSYDALEAREQETFLDIACFFRGKNIDRVVELLESFGHRELDHEIGLLINRCLIDVSHKKIMMHDLIQDMGREIVRRESLSEYGKQSRIWLRNDMNRVFIQQNGLEETRGIVLDLEEEGESDIEAKYFLKMTKLRILEINNVLVDKDLEYLSNLLGFLNWPGYPSKFLPPTFQPDNLLELRMPCSHIVQLWEGKTKFGKLKLIDLSNSKNLLKMPDLSGVRNLESLVLHGCTSLCEIHPSVTRLNQLILLDMKDCSNLKRFSSKISCKNLKTFILSGCSSLEMFPEIEGKMEHLAELYLDRTAIEKLHPSIGRLSGLVLLILRECKRLSSLPNVIGNFKSLRTLILHGCSLLDEIELSSENAACLEELDLSETSLNKAPSSIHYLNNLKMLHCQGLLNSIWHSLNSPPFGFGLGSLKDLNLSYCNLVDEDVPQDLQSFSSLEILDLSGNHFVSLGKYSLRQLKNLKKLFLNNCTRLQRLPLPEMLPASLREVQGRDCVSISEYFYNKELLIPSIEVGVLTISFPISDEQQNFRCIEGADVSSTENRMLKQRLLEVYTSDRERYHISSELKQVFDCFDYKKKGTHVEFPSNFTRNDEGIYAIALAATTRILEFTALGTTLECDFLVRLETDGHPPKILLNIERSSKLLSRTKVWVFYLPFEELSKELINQNQDFCYIKASIRSNNPNVKVEKCGASVLFRKNVGVFMGNMLGKFFKNRPNFVRVTKDCDHLSEGRFVEVEDLQEYCSVSDTQNNDSSSGESDSIVLLKRSLKSLIRGTIEEENVNLAPIYIFPGQRISSWFKHKQEQPTLTIMLPLNLHKNKKWMGLALFVVFSVQEHSETSYTFAYEIDSDESQLAHAPCAQMPMFLLDGSHQVCVLFHPRVGFPYILNKCDHIYVKIITHPDVKVVSCGARLVYQQNVDGLIKTITDCISHCPKDLHDFYSQKVMENFIFSITKLKGFDASLTDTVASEPIIQEPFKIVFDCILNGYEFLSWFTWREEGNIIVKRLPKSLYRDGTWMGFVLYALVVANRPTTKDQDSERPLKLVDLVCQFKVDSDIIEPDHFFITSEDDILEGEAQQFIWLFYIPRSEFSVAWRHCATFGALLTTNRPELFSVWECGMHPVHLQDKEMIQVWAASKV